MFVKRVKWWYNENGVTPNAYYAWQKKLMHTAVSCFAEFPAPQEQLCIFSKTLVASIQAGKASLNLYAGTDSQVVQLSTKR